MDTLALLQQAIDGKAKLQVIYHGGSMAGKLREVSPISIKGPKLRAKCHVSDAFKTFLVDKMQVMSGYTGALTSEKVRDKVRPKFENLGELETYCNKHIDLNSFAVVYGETSLTVHKKYKNGKVQKGIQLGLSFQETGIEYLNDEQTEVREFVRDRPWIVSCKKKTSVSYRYFDKATNRFVDWFEEMFL